MSKDPTCPKRTDKNPSKENVSIFLTSPKKHPVNQHPLHAMNGASNASKWVMKSFRTRKSHSHVDPVYVTKSFTKTPVIIPGNLKDPSRPAARPGWNFCLPNFWADPGVQVEVCYFSAWFDGFKLCRPPIERVLEKRPAVIPLINVCKTPGTCGKLMATLIQHRGWRWRGAVYRDNRMQRWSTGWGTNKHVRCKRLGTTKSDERKRHMM